MGTKLNDSNTELNKTELGSWRQQLTHRQMRFLAELPFCDTEKEAAQRAGVSKQTVSLWKHDPAFVEAFECAWSADLERRRNRLEQGVGKAVERLLQLLDCKNPYIVLKTACEILNRAGYTPQQETEFKVSPELMALLAKAVGDVDV